MMTRLTSTTVPQQAEITPLVLPEMTREQARVNNDLCRLQPVSFAVESHDFSCRFTSDSADFLNFLTLHFSLSGQVVTLDCDQALTALLVASYLPEEALLFLPETLRIATVQAALAPFLRALQQSTGLTPSLCQAPVVTKRKSVKPTAEAGTCRLYGQLGSAQGQGHFCLDLPQELYQQLLPLLGNRQQGAMVPWQQLPHHCPLILAQTRLSAHQLARLQRQDVVFFDTCYYREEKPLLRVNISSRQHCLVLAEPNALTVQEIITNLNGSNDMNNEQIAMDEIPVILTFEAGNLTLPLGELNQLSTGHVFAFDTQANSEQEIQIKANGQVIGACTLVNVAGKLGAKITRLNNVAATENAGAETNVEVPTGEPQPAAEQSSEALEQEMQAEQATQE
ncbi:type III secretion system cytoplasmic ring protein SctQ [Thalassomonas viridans]|uniref:Type III secretion system cytoplasmic ring protein SctQ n=1 Tax=Thalassomonas viridans TaxID=137584 RepID=A0AAE9YXP0_9GAMM|nr:type III secretion system cytoplasmic ring protein SctQ [Thalassomonas viridans]WDE02823.1 type III secretion system cytoplasmic ring protein SctQ [Thalassomonas viridans]